MVLPRAISRIAWKSATSAFSVDSPSLEMAFIWKAHSMNTAAAASATPADAHAPNRSPAQSIATENSASAGAKWKGA